MGRGGSVVRAYDRLTIDWSLVRILLRPFGNFVNFLPHFLCQCLSEETLKAVGPFYLVSMPGEVKYPTQRVNMYR